jgi:hypothetical protein
MSHASIPVNVIRCEQNAATRRCGVFVLLALCYSLAAGFIVFIEMSSYCIGQEIID